MDLKIGQIAQRQMAVTHETVKAYAELTGDYNPLHFDEEFGGRTRFGRLISQGGIATGLLHALVAMDMPGPGTVFMQQEWHFPAPVYVGDTITAEATVKSINPRHPVATIDFRITNQDGVEVLTGEAVVMQVPLDPTEPSGESQ